MRERVIKRFPRRARIARMEGAISLRFRGDVAAGNKELEALNLQMPSEFVPLFYMSFWKRDYAECRRLLGEVAKYPELESDRWDKELQLAFVTKAPFDQQAARDAEKRLEERLQQAINRDEEGELKVG